MTELLKPSELHKLNEICRLIDEELLQEGDMG